MIHGAWKSLTIVAASGVALAACASLKSKPAAPLQAAPVAEAAAAPALAPTAPVVVKVPVPVKEACVPKNFPKAPKYPDTDAALRDAGGAADRYQMLAAGRLLRIQRLADLEKILDGCR